MFTNRKLFPADTVLSFVLLSRSKKYSNIHNSKKNLINHLVSIINRSNLKQIHLLKNVTVTSYNFKCFRQRGAKIPLQECDRLIK